MKADELLDAKDRERDEPLVFLSALFRDNRPHCFSSDESERGSDVDADATKRYSSLFSSPSSLSYPPPASSSPSAESCGAKIRQ